MRILIVDNGTRNLAQLRTLCGSHEVAVTEPEELSVFEASQADAVILSGISGGASARHDAPYRSELAVIRSHPGRVVGVCLGFELIAKAFGGKLRELPERESGEIEISVVTDDPIFEDRLKFRGREAHRFGVDSVKPPLKVLAESKDGVEVIRHENRPIIGFQFHPERSDDPVREMFRRAVGIA